MRRIIGAIAAPLIAVGALAGTGAVILHRAVPAELHDHLLGVGAALVIIGLLAAIAVVFYLGPAGHLHQIRRLRTVPDLAERPLVIAVSH